MSPEISLSKWGNSQGLRIPKEIINALQMNIGDKVRIFIENNRVIIEPVKKKKVYNLDELIAKIPSDYKKEPELFSTPMGREIW
jgi:antitoxin MazE